VTDDLASVRRQEVAFALARRLLDQHFSGDGRDRRLWLFPRLAQICRSWLDTCVHVEAPFTVGRLMLAEAQAEAVEAIYHAITIQTGNRPERLRPMLRRFDPVGSTAGVSFLTRKNVVPTEKSEISHVTLDGQGGNTWEQIISLECEAHRQVAAYAKNDHLGFTIPYVHKGRTHAYLPDFLLRLRRADGEDFDRTLIVEVSGSQKSPGPTKTKALTARDSWCAAVNNHDGLGRWGYSEITSMIDVKKRLDDAIQALYDDAPLIGDPDVLDFAGV
jgi:type III restriction enzyme